MEQNQTETLYKLKAFKDSEGASPEVRSKYFNWLCPTKEEKATFLGRYVATNPDDVGTAGAMAGETVGVVEHWYDLLANREIDDRIYHFNPLDIGLYIKEFSSDLAELFAKAFITMREVLQMNKETAKERKMEEDRGAVIEMSTGKEKKKHKGHIGREKYAGEDRPARPKVDWGAKAREDARLASYNDNVHERGMGGGGSFLDMLFGLFGGGHKESEPAFAPAMSV